MADKKTKLLMVLGGLAVLSLTYGIFTPSSKRRTVPPPAAEAVAPKVPRLLNLSMQIERYPQHGYYDNWGKNPFLPKEVSARRSSVTLILNGIVWDPKQPSAVINDHIVGVGDEVLGSKVVAISQNRVVLNNGREDFELRLISQDDL
jgi:type II secretory pathway component PulC